MKRTGRRGMRPAAKQLDDQAPQEPLTSSLTEFIKNCNNGASIVFEHLKMLAPVVALRQGQSAIELRIIQPITK